MPALAHHAMVLAFFLALLLFAPRSALAQLETDPSRVAPRDLRPSPSTPPAVMEQEQPAQPDDDGLPEEVAALRVMVADVVVEGGFPELEAAATRLIEPFSGCQCTVGELQELAEAIERLYHEAGYFLVRVTIPPQQLEDGGRFQLMVIDGYLEAFNLDAVPEPLQPELMAILRPLVQKPRLTRAEVERAMLLVGRTPGLAIRSTLMPGQEAGATVLLLQGEREWFGGSLSVDNRLSDEIGPWSSTLQVQLNQPLNRGEQFYAYYSWRPLSILGDKDRTREVVGGGISWPLGHDGLSLNLEMMTSETFLESDIFFIPDTSSTFDRTSLRLSKSLWLARRGELSVTGVFEAGRQINEVPDFDLELYRDELRVLRLNLNASGQLTERSHLALFLQLSHGISTGARTEKDVRRTGVPFSRAGAGPDFAKVEMSANWFLALPSRLQLASTLRIQRAISGDPLPSSELFSLDGEDAISAMVSGGLADDGGWTLREELTGSYAPGNGRVRLSPYVYFTGGVPSSELGTAVDYSLGSGIGLRGGSGPVDFSMEYGKSRIEPFGETEDEFFATLRVAF